MPINFQPVPSYAEPFTKDEKTGQPRFSTEWLDWFLHTSDGTVSGTIDHNLLSDLQGGAAGEYFHFTQAEYTNRLTRDPNFSISSVSPTGSPFTYTNSSSYDMDLLVSGGSVSLISFARAGGTPVPVGAQTSGFFHLSPTDALTIQYSSAPTLLKVPR